MNSERVAGMTFNVFHLFAGIGGGAWGFQEARGEWRGLHGRFQTLGAVDVDPEACEDFEALTGVPAACLDLFSREDYEVFHGAPPPDGWREATPEVLRAAAGGERPDVVFSSPPCKGFSALLPTKAAGSAKYQALNRLTIRGVWLALEAWKQDPPGLFILENVPRITSRGKPLLEQIHALLRVYGYETQEGTHDVGEVGGLAQHRRRYLLVARHPSKVPAFLYRPLQRRVRAIGEVLEELPMPGDPAGGPMHRLPRLNWLTWVRLALIPAGGDWRDLQGIEPGQYAIEPVTPHFNHSYRVTPWDDPAGAVAGGGGPGSGAIVAADPRLGHEPRKGVFRVGRWDEAAGTVVGAASVRGSNGMAAVADPRLTDRPGRHWNKFRVQDWDKPAGTVFGTDAARVGSGAPCVADPRLGYHAQDGAMRVTDWDAPAPTVTGSAAVTSSNGPGAVADPRLTCNPRSGAYQVIPWDEPAGAVTGAGDVHAQGAAAVADPRLPADSDQGVWVIVAEDGTWHRPLTTLELAALQGFPTVMPDGRPLALAGKSQARWRERIGNAVPPPAARGIADMMLLALIPATVGAWILSPLGTAIWVRAILDWLVQLRVARRVITLASQSHGLGGGGGC